MDLTSFALVSVSALVAWIAVSIFFAFVSTSILKTKTDRLLARTMEIFLYLDNLRDFFGALGRSGLAAVRILRSLVWPLILASAGVLPILVLAEPVLSKRPFEKNTPFLVELQATEGHSPPEFPLSGRGVVSTAPPVRIPSERKTVWRMEIPEDFEGTDPRILLEEVGEIPLTACTGNGWIVRRWTRSSVSAALPGIGKIMTPGRISEISVAYPDRRFRWLAIELDWMGAVALLSFVISIPLALLKMRIRG